MLVLVAMLGFGWDRELVSGLALESGVMWVARLEAMLEAVWGMKLEAPLDMVLGTVLVVVLASKLVLAMGAMLEAMSEEPSACESGLVSVVTSVALLGMA